MNKIICGLMVVMFAFFTSCAGAEFDKKNFSDLQVRYQEIEKRYLRLKDGGHDTSFLNPLISDIKKAKKKKDFNELSELLSKLDVELSNLDKNGQAIIVGSQENHGNKVSDKLPFVPTLVEMDMLKQLAYRKNFQLLHQFKGAPDNFSSNGAATRNREKFSDVAAQREALWLLRYGLIVNKPEYVKKGIKAFDYAFQYQTADGNFRNGRGVSSRKAVGVDAFFLYSFTHAYLLLKDDNTYTEQWQDLDIYRERLKQASIWLAQNADELYRQDRHTPNRLLFDAMAFFFASKITGDSKFEALGDKFLTAAFTLQRNDGVFEEKGGHDSSYQAVTILNLSILAAHFKHDAFEKKIESSIEKAVEWLIKRIETNGKVSAQGNTRTGLGQEIQSGKEKDINYAEVALSLYYSAYILNKPQYLDVADKVVDYVLKHSAR